MKLLELKDVVGEEAAVYYRQKYEAIAVFEGMMNEVFEVPIFFVIEIDPLNQKKVDIQLKKNVEYPLIPLIKLLKEHILTRHNEGMF